MLNRANVSLIEDGRSQGDIRQGITFEVMGEDGEYTSKGTTAKLSNYRLTN